MSYRELYFELFRAMDRTVTHLDRGELLLARWELIAAMEAGEEAHLEVDLLPEEAVSD